jgi:hypothetical protein
VVVQILGSVHLLQDTVFLHGDPLAHGHRLSLVVGDV